MKSLLKPSLDWLLVCVPIAIAMRLLGFGSPTALFVVACLAVIPLAGWMGKATEHLAEKVGEGIGGLLNATFGNAAELIIALIALQKGLYGVVKASITGSIIGNILLVLGLSFVMGGAKYSEQRFNKTAARSAATTLILAAIALLLPTLFHQTAGDAWTPQLEQRLSLAIAIVLFLTYGATLAFSLITHKSLFAGGGHGAHAAPADASELSASGATTGAVADVAATNAPTTGAIAIAPVGAGASNETPLSATTTAQELNAAEEHGEGWSKGKSIGVLVVATVFVALMSEFLVGSVEAARESLGLTEVFVGVIVVAIIGNAAEHSTAVLMALRNKPDLSISIALGSSVQIALFVAPVLVFASYFIGPTRLDLEFTIPEVAAVLVAVGITAQIAGDGESNWLEGAQLLAVYAVLGILFFFLPEIAHGASEAIGAAQ